MRAYLTSDVVAALLALALALAGAASVLATPARPVSPDDALYASQAVRLTTSRPLDEMDGQPSLTRPPVYAAALAAAHAVTGDWEFAERVVGAVAAVVAIAIAFAIARSLGATLGGVAAAALVLSPGILPVFGRSAIDGLQVAVLLAALGATIRALGGPGAGKGWAVVAGLAFAAAILIKESALVFLPWPVLWALVRPAGDTAPVLRRAGLVVGVALVAALPWWLWVASAGGVLYPSRIGGNGLLAGLAAYVGAAVVALALAVPAVSRPIARLVDRVRPDRRWALAILLTIVWAMVIVVLFLASQARFSLTHRPSAGELLQAIGDLAPVLVDPLLVTGLVVAAVVYAARGSVLLRGVVLAIAVAAGLVGIVIIKGWDPRSIAIFAILGAIVAGALVGNVDRVAGRLEPAVRPALRVGIAVVLAVVVLGSGVDLALAWHRPVVFRASSNWSNDAVGAAASWISANASPGEPIVTGWLYGAALDADTGGRYHWLLMPTLQLRVGHAGEPALVATGTLFRDGDAVPATPPTDWMVVRRHPTEQYYVGLSAGLLAETLHTPGVRYLVVTGEQVPQSTATMAPFLAEWPGLTEVQRFVSADATIVIFSVDPVALYPDPGPLELTTPTFDALVAEFRASRPEGPAAAFRQLLGDRDLEFVPTDEAAAARAATLLASP